jgi:glutamate racemase
MPDEQIVYLGDTARVPYGTKSAQTVQRYAIENGRVLLGYGVKAIVVACNTASSVAFDRLCEALPVPVVDVVRPGARAAAAATQTGRVGLIATRGTVNSMAYERHLQTLNREIEVFSATCALFVPLAEEGWTDGAVPQATAREYLIPLLDHEIDVLILGCTHYPLLKGIIQEVCGETVTLIDSADAAAADVKELLESRGLARTAGSAAEHRFLVTDLPEQFELVAARFFGRDHMNLTLVDLPAAGGRDREVERGGT